MPRSVELSVPAEVAETLLERLQDVDGVVGLARHPHASVSPPGDILTVQVTNDGMRPLFALLNEMEVPHKGAIQTSEVRSFITADNQRSIDRESNETIWDEMASLLRQDTNTDFNYLALMFLAGAIAAVGLWTDTLHIVVGAMIIAPAFEPLVRIPFGLVARNSELSTRGALSAATGYLMLLLGGLITVLLLRVVDTQASTDLQTRSWVQFWSNVTVSGVATSLFAAAAGVIVISGQRAVLTTGVMIALALIPSMSLVGMGIATADFALAGRGFVRWAVDAALVLVMSGLILWLKQVLLHRNDRFSMEQNE